MAMCTIRCNQNDDEFNLVDLDTGDDGDDVDGNENLGDANNANFDFSMTETPSFVQCEGIGEFMIETPAWIQNRTVHIRPGPSGQSITHIFNPILFSITPQPQVSGFGLLGQRTTVRKIDPGMNHTALTCETLISSTLSMHRKRLIV
ncbi:Uncharacterized protein Fot_33055 [Forsythia ovata]|uniref:Uncharacterized protein n=1 Tax=Forsythia ovata TaxID=205694 RepID=A0ABD1TA48_9LAMI